MGNHHSKADRQHIRKNDNKSKKNQGSAEKEIREANVNNSDATDTRKTDFPPSGNPFQVNRMLGAIAGVEYFCDECGKKIPSGSARIHCWECEDYDECQACWDVKGHHHKIISRETEDIFYLRKSVPGRSTCNTLCKAFGIFRERPCLGMREGENAPFVWQTYGEIFERCKNVGSALRQNFPTRTFVGIISENRTEYNITDWACMIYAMVSVPIHSDFSEKEMNQIVAETKMACVFCSKKYFTKLLRAVSLSPPKSLAQIVLFGEDENFFRPFRDQFTDLKFLSFKQLEEEGERAQLEVIEIQPDDLLTLSYTSGSTGSPKGAMISDRFWNWDICVDNAHLPRYLVVVSFLPTSHGMDRSITASAICSGGQVAISTTGDVAQLFKDLRAVRPTYFSAPPAIWIKIYKDFHDSLAATQAMLKSIEDIEKSRADLMQEYRSILGGRAGMLSTGGGPTPAYVFPFIKECFGLTLAEGYGVTEVGSFVTDRRVHYGVQVKLLDVPELGYTNGDLPHPRGEICVRREKFPFMGYFNDQSKTNQVTEDGWYRTGDIGMIDVASEELHIIDRLNNVFKLVQGEFIAPEKLEGIFSYSPYVRQIFVTAIPTQFRVVAIVVPREEAVRKFANEHKILDVSATSVCKDEIFAAEIRANLHEIGLSHNLKYYEIPCAVHLEPDPFTAENQKLTPSMKFRRKFLREFYEPVVANLYQSAEIAEAAIQKKCEALALSNRLAGEAQQKDGDELQTRIQNVITEEWNKLHGSELGNTNVNPNLVSQGLSSFSAVHLSQFLSKNLGVPVGPEILYQENPAKAVAQIIVNPAQSTSLTNWREEFSLPNIPNQEIDGTLPDSANISNVLLTGATGFLGIFLLREILAQFPDSAVFCLVRARDEGSAIGRIRKEMVASLLWKDEFEKRIKIVSGNLEEESLGLYEDQFLDLACHIDVIFHCGAYVNSVAPYAVLKKANVRGTNEMIRLALIKKRKFFFHVSSLSVLDVYEGNFDEIPFDELAIKLDSASGYSQSKFVSDQLVRLAQAKFGMPTIIFRPCDISGDTKSGYSNPKDTINIIISAIAQLGVSPRSEAEFEMCPVDAVARSIVGISKSSISKSGASLQIQPSTPATSSNPSSFLKIFHYKNPCGPVSLRAWTSALRKCGFQIKEVDYHVWLDRVSQAEQLPIYALYPILQHGLGNDSLKISNKSSFSPWTKDISCPEMGEDILVQYCKWITK